MSKDVKVTSINVQIGQRKIELTVEEAKKLKGILEDIFGKATEVKLIEREIIKDRTWPYPYIHWTSQPLYDTGKAPKYRPYEITCDSSKNLLQCRAD